MATSGAGCLSGSSDAQSGGATGGSSGGPSATGGSSACTEAGNHCTSSADCCGSYSCVGGVCSAPSSHVVTCTTTPGPHATWEPTCTCTADSNPGTASFSGDSCDAQSAGLAKFCCADDSFPGSSSSCQCWFENLDWACTGYDTSSCECAFLDTTTLDSNYLTSVCDNVPGSDGVPWHCCADTLGNCVCKEGVACTAGKTEVSQCATPPSWYGTPPSGCPSGTTLTYGCTAGSSGGSCQTASDCPGQCSGDSIVCCPTCNSGTCGQTCCDPSGNCS